MSDQSEYLKRFSKEALEKDMEEYYKNPRICPKCGEIVAFHEGIPVEDENYVIGQEGPSVKILCWTCGDPHNKGVAV